MPGLGLLMRMTVHCHHTEQKIIIGIPFIFSGTPSDKRRRFNASNFSYDSQPANMRSYKFALAMAVVLTRPALPE